MHARLRSRPELRATGIGSRRARRPTPEVEDRRPPSRASSPLVTVAATAAVAVAAAAVAHGFREVLSLVARAIAADGGQVGAVQALGVLPAALVVAAGLGFAAWADRRLHRARSGRLGLHVLATSVHDERAPEPSLGGTVARGGATLVTTASFAPLGREAPILELGGALGDATGRRTGVSRPHLAVAGIASAFAVAYHAPVAAVLYVGEHLRLHRDRRSMVAAGAGAVIGTLAARVWFGSHTVFPAGTSPLSHGSLALVTIGVLPAWAASRAFVTARRRATDPSRLRRRSMPVMIAATAIAAAVVAVAPGAAGNGMEALRLAHDDPTMRLAAVLLLGKLVATTAALASGAPGGVLSPSLAVAAGAAMTTWYGLDAAGVPLPADRWGALLVTMVIGVAVGVRTPVVAVVLLAEMSGDVRVVPVALVVVALTLTLDHAVRSGRSWLRPGAATVRDEDA